MSKVAVLCQCGWGNLAMEESEIPANCPVCGFEFKEGEGTEGTIEVKEIHVTSRLRLFTDADRQAFAGTETPDAMIGERGPDIVIVDGNRVAKICVSSSGPDEILAAFVPSKEHAILLGEVLLDLNDNLREAFALSCMKKVN